MNQTVTVCPVAWLFPVFTNSFWVVLCDPSLPPGQPVPTWSWGRVYLSASSVLHRSSSSPWASWLSLSVHTTRPLPVNASGLSRSTSHQPVPVLLSSLSCSFLSKRLLLLFHSTVLRSIFPAWWSRISCVVHASSTEWSLRYTAWLWHWADPHLSENRSAWLRSAPTPTNSLRLQESNQFTICEKFEATVIVLV